LGSKACAIFNASYQDTMPISKWRAIPVTKTMTERWEKAANKIVDMDRSSLIRTLRGLRCGFAIDFTDAFLEAVSLDQLKHIVLAASLHDKRQG